MAHAAIISTLVDGLIGAITEWTPENDGRRLRQSKDAAVRAFRSQLHPRVNHFDIQARFEGLEEKFIVLNREPLADALHSRREELTKRSTKWTPEVLAFLLNLSDRPAEKTDLLDLDDDKDDVTDAPPPLTWADILAEDPLTEEGIWDDVVIDDSDYSDEDVLLLSDDTTEHTTYTQASSLGDEDIAAFAGSFIVTRDETAVDSVQAAQAQLRRARPDKRADSYSKITNLQAIRELLLMLRGLPTLLFGVDTDLEVYARPHFCTNTCEPSTFGQVMCDFAALGSQLGRLRASTSSSTKYGLLQRLNIVVQGRLRLFEKGLTQLEQRFLSSHADVVVSLSNMLAEARQLSSPLSCLAGVVLREQTDPTPWTILDDLFDLACKVRLGGEPEDFDWVAHVFFQCLEIYLKPVHLWMTQGKLQDPDGIFFVRSTKQNTDPSLLWHTRFMISKRPDGSVDAPKFIQTAVSQIFNAGKNVMFLDALKHGVANDLVDHVRMEGLDVSLIDKSLDESLLPFSSVVEGELQRWINGLQIHSTRCLYDVMLSQCGLESTIDAIDHLFLSKDGARFQQFSDQVFARVSRKKMPDRFFLTDLAQSTLGLPNTVDAERISVRFSRKAPSSASESSPVEILDRLRIDYNTSWPVRNVIRNFTICQRAFTVSFRAYRAEYLLTNQQQTLQAVNSHNKRKLGPMLVLRQRLIWFASTFRGYTSEVTSTTMRQLRTDMQHAADLDAMTMAYDEFQSRLEARLLLRKNLQPIAKSLLSLLEICEDLAILWTQAIEVDDQSASSTNSARYFSSTRVDPQSDLSDDEEAPPLEHRQKSPHNVDSLSAEYGRHLHFLIAGLRGVSRVGGEASWISLAERLQLGADYLDQR